MPIVEMERRQVVIIGAGPSGAIAAALLKRKGHDVLVIERQHFPRFSIGESLLSHCLDFVEEAGMLEAVNAAGFQRKNGAAFAWGERYSAFDFGDTFTAGKPTTLQVQRADFDKLLADQAALQGAEIRYGDAIVSVDVERPRPQLDVRREDGSELVPQQVIELSRDYVSPPTDATGTTTEREILANELRREMSASIIRRIDSVVRAEIEKGGSLSAPKDKPIEGAVPAEPVPAAKH